MSSRPDDVDAAPAPPDDAAQTTIDALADADADSDTSVPSMLSVEDPTKTANTMLAILATLPVGTKLGRYVLRKSRWSRIVFAQGMWAMWVAYRRRPVRRRACCTATTRLRRESDGTACPPRHRPEHRRGHSTDSNRPDPKPRPDSFRFSP